MDTYKAFKFYKKQNDNTLKELAKLFSHQKNYYSLDNRTVLIHFSPDDYLTNINAIECYYNFASFLIMTDFKFINLAKSHKKLKFSLVDVEFQMKSGDVLCEEETNKYFLSLKNDDYEYIRNKINTENIQFKSIKIKIDHVYMKISNYGTISFSSKIDKNLLEVIMRIVNYLFEGIIDEKY